MNDMSEKLNNLSPSKRALFEKLLKEKSVISDTRIPKRNPTQPLSLSFAQQRLWFLDQLEPNTPLYNLSKAIRLGGKLNVAALEQSINEILRRHEALRTTFANVNGDPVQVIAQSRTMTLAPVDFSQLPEDVRDERLRQAIAEESKRPFNLARDCLLRVTLWRLNEAEHLLLFVTHHIASDGWSLGVLFRELTTLYKAFALGQPSPLAELPIQYADFALWQRDSLQGEMLEQQLSYWKQQMADAPAEVELPTDYLRTAKRKFRGAEEVAVLSKNLTAQLNSLSSREGATLFMTLLAAFQLLLHRYTGQDEVVVGSPIAGRNRAEIENLIGFFLNTLVLRTDLSGDLTFKALLGRVREMAIGALEHQDLPFEKLLDELQPDRSLSHTPLFQVFFNMVNLHREKIELPGLVAENFQTPLAGSMFDLTLYVREENAQITLHLVYDADLFGQPRMAEMLRQYEHLLFQCAENPDEKIDKISLVTRSAAQLLPDPNETLHSEWRGAVHELFSQQARRSPNHTAIADKFGTWSYRELDGRSNQLANRLRAANIKSQDVVAIYAQRNSALVCALLGILKAGAIFVVIDPAYPAARSVACLGQAKHRAWIQIQGAGTMPDILENFVTRLPGCCRIELSPHADEISNDLSAEYSSDAPCVEVRPDDLAYIAFTSGSTGVPKGVLGRHAPLTHFAHWAKPKFELNQTDKFSMLSGLSHDPLHRDIFTPLQLGATICVPDAEEIGTPGWLAQWIERERITIVNLTPAMNQLLTETATGEMTTLRYAFFVGDVLKKNDVAKLQKQAPAITCINLYGSTETQRAVGHFIVPRVAEDTINNDAPEKPVLKEITPLGRGIEAVQLLVLNDSQRLTGIGEVGEIYFRSPYLAQGYLADETLTHERFMINPFTQNPDDKLYKTGDFARYMPDGNVEFAGRGDYQVKIRGFRIELGEIESVLSQHACVRECVVTIREDVMGEKRLIAYVVPFDSQTISSSELRRYLQERLPDYMIPSSFVMLEALPLTPNGKINRRALPDPVLSLEDRTFVAPTTALEKILAEIWSELLGVERVGIHDNFFKLGGYSLLATRVVARVRETFQIEIPLRYLFEQPTIAGLAVIMLLHSEAGDRIEKTAQLLINLMSLTEDEAEILLNENNAQLREF